MKKKMIKPYTTEATGSGQLCVICGEPMGEHLNGACVKKQKHYKNSGLTTCYCCGVKLNEDGCHDKVTRCPASIYESEHVVSKTGTLKEPVNVGEPTRRAN